MSTVRAISDQAGTRQRDREDRSRSKHRRADDPKGELHEAVRNPVSNSVHGEPVEPFTKSY